MTSLGNQSVTKTEPALSHCSSDPSNSLWTAIIRIVPDAMQAMVRHVMEEEDMFPLTHLVANGVSRDALSMTFELEQENHLYKYRVNSTSHAWNHTCTDYCWCNVKLDVDYDAAKHSRQSS